VKKWIGIDICICKCNGYMVHLLYGIDIFIPHSYVFRALYRIFFLAQSKFSQFPIPVQRVVTNSLAYLHCGYFTR
jgi:hypothetical protein